MDGALTPEMLQEVRFTRARHGYRVEDVDAYVARVADHLACLRVEAAALRRRVAELEAERPEQRARHVLAAASSVAEAVVAEAAREAEAVATERHRRLASTASALLRSTEACAQGLALVDALRAELRAADAAIRPLVESSPDAPAGPAPQRDQPASPVRAPASPALADGSA